MLATCISISSRAPSVEVDFLLTIFCVNLGSAYGVWALGGMGC
jgi:hypothetical protein